MPDDGGGPSETGGPLDAEALRQEVERLRERLALYDRLLAQLGDVVYEHDYRTQSYLRMDPGIEGLVGIPADRIALSDWSRLVQSAEMQGRSRRLTEAEASRLMESGELEAWECEYRVLRDDGEVVWLADTSVPVRDPEGRVCGSFGLLRDVTQLRQAQEEASARRDRLLRQSEALTLLSCSGTTWRQGHRAALREMLRVTADALDVARVGIWLLESDPSRIRCELLYRRGEEGFEADHTFHEAQFPAYFEALRKVRVIAASDAATDPRTREYRDSYLAEFGITSRLDTPIRTAGHLAGVLCIEHVGPPRRWWPDEAAFAGSIADFAAATLAAERRQAAAEALQASEQRYRELVESLRLFSVTLDPAGRIVDGNQALAAALGFSQEELRGLDWVEQFVPSEEQEQCRRILLGSALRSRQAYESWVVGRDGRRLRVEWHCTPFGAGEQLGVGCIGVDITQRQRAEEQLRRSQRLDSMGRLAGGVAHDFNNLLTAILGFTEIGESVVNDPARCGATIQQIRFAANRGRELTSQLLTFARKRESQPRALNLNDQIRALERLLRRLIGERVELITRLAPDLPPVVIDPSRLDQILVNLSVNAADAMPEGGRLEIRTETLSGPGPAACRLIVSDTGVGMTDEVRSRIFEPFFTTKPPDRGTGLGLATCYGIVSQAGGRIEVESVPGEGTTFTVILPAALQAAETPPPARIEPASGGTEAVLLVEDDPLLRRMAVQALALYGYRVRAAESGPEALALLDEATEEPSLLVTDIALPGMSGPELAIEARRRSGNLRVLYVSGQIGEPDPRLAEGPARGRFLAKPFSPGELLGRVREMLDAEPDA